MKKYIDKKSFVLYNDMYSTFELLSDENAGKLIKHIFQYCLDKNPEISDDLLKISFEPIKQSLKRDLKKYENRCIQNSINGKNNAEYGKLGGRPKKIITTS